MVHACLTRRSLVNYVAHHSIRFGLNYSLTGRNVLCCSRWYDFDVSDVLTNNSRFISDTIHLRARSEVTEVQMHEVDLLFECILIRDGQAALPCWFHRSDEQTIVNYICTVCEVFSVCIFFLFLFFVFFCIIFRVPWYNLHNK